MVASHAIFAKHALLPEGWAEDVRLTIERGSISGIFRKANADSADVTVDTLLPAQGNLHSHSFQRAMAGMTEYRAAGQESFWTWRDMMYRFLDHLTPEDIEAVAAQVFVEMLEAGYASVGEFHYVHHKRGGEQYADIAELSARIMAGAATAGIGLTHLPVLYCYGGAGAKPLSGGQLRFGNDLEAFARLHERCGALLKDMPPDTVLGLAPHSLRAVTPEVLSSAISIAGSAPFHIHVAEQPREVEEVGAWLGARPVEWLLANAGVGPSWCAIHATHMTPEETHGLARSGAVAGLCPITEANLGDGPFNGPGWLSASGDFGVGSDSNVRISMTEEFRTLEYSQRLRDLARNVLVPDHGSVGTFLYANAARGSARALGRNAGEISEGKTADLLAIDSMDLALCGLKREQLLDGLCFVATDKVVKDVWSAGRHVVKGGRHVARETVANRYRHTISSLASRL